MKNLIQCLAFIFAISFFFASCSESTPKTAEQLRVLKEYRAFKKIQDSIETAETVKLEAEKARILKEKTFFGPVISIQEEGGNSYITYQVNTKFKGEPIVASCVVHYDLVTEKHLDSTIFSPVLIIWKGCITQDGWETKVLFK